MLVCGGYRCNTLVMHYACVWGGSIDRCNTLVMYQKVRSKFRGEVLQKTALSPSPLLVKVRQGARLDNVETSLPTLIFDTIHSTQ